MFNNTQTYLQLNLYMTHLDDVDDDHHPQVGLHRVPDSDHDGLSNHQIFPVEEILPLAPAPKMIRPSVGSTLQGKMVMPPIGPRRNPASRPSPCTSIPDASARPCGNFWNQHIYESCRLTIIEHNNMCTIS